MAITSLVFPPSGAAVPPGAASTPSRGWAGRLLPSPWVWPLPGGAPWTGRTRIPGPATTQTRRPGLEGTHSRPRPFITELAPVTHPGPPRPEPERDHDLRTPPPGGTVSSLRARPGHSGGPAQPTARSGTTRAEDGDTWRLRGGWVGDHRPPRPPRPSQERPRRGGRRGRGGHAATYSERRTRTGSETPGPGDGAAGGAGGCSLRCV